MKFLDCVIGLLAMVGVIGMVSMFTETGSSSKQGEPKGIGETLISAISQPNRWNYTFPMPPWIDNQDFRDIHASLMVDKYLSDPKEARSYSLELYQDFIEKVNSARMVRPFLLEFPVTPKNCHIGIKFCTSESKERKRPYIDSIQLGGRGEFVQYYEPNAKLLKSRGWLEKGTLAAEIPELLQLSHNGVPRQPIQVKPTIPTLETMLFSKKTPTYHFFDFIKILAPKLSLKLIVVGAVTEALKALTINFSAALTSDAQMSLNQVRTLAGTLTRESGRFIEQDSTCLNYCKSLSEKKSLDLFPLEKFVYLRISFWDDNIDRVKQPDIAEVRYGDCKFTYYTADELQRLVPVYEETLEEAMKFLDHSPSDKACPPQGS